MLCLYAQFLNRSFRSVQSIRNYLSGVKTLHKILEIEYSTSNMFQLNLLLRGIARSKQHVPKKAAPITPLILKDIHGFICKSKDIELVLWSLFLLMFFLMARKSNMIPNSVSEFDPKKQLTRGDIEIQNDMLIVNFKWSKTRQFGHSRKIPIVSIPNSCLCPVQAYSKMISKVKASADHPAFCYFNSKSRLLPIVYSQFHRYLRKYIAFTGRDERNYSSHSFRRGGISWGFAASCRTELLKYHGDWASDAYLEYLTYDFSQKLSFSKQMSLKILSEI